MTQFRVTYLQKDGFDCNTVTVEAVSSVEAEQKVKQMPDCDAVLAVKAINYIFGRKHKTL